MWQFDYFVLNIEINESCNVIKIWDGNCSTVKYCSELLKRFILCPHTFIVIC